MKTLSTLKGIVHPKNEIVAVLSGATDINFVFLDMPFAFSKMDSN